MKVGTPHTCSPGNPLPSDRDDDIDEVPKLVAQQAGSGAHATSACAPISTPVLHPLMRLPYELWQVIASYLIADSPFLKRPGQPTPQFPIASTMRDLRSMSLGSAHLREIVRKLRKEPRFHPWRELAGRALYEFHKKTEAGRQLSIELYGTDPVFPTSFPQLLTATVFSPEQSQRLCASLERNCQQVQELQLHIKCDQDTDELSRALGRCAHLHRLVLSTNGFLSRSFFSSLTSGLRLDSLTIRNASLEAEVLAEIARGGRSERLETLALQAKSLTEQHWKALQQVAEHSPMLCAITLGTTMSLPDCLELGQLIQKMPRLQFLSIGSDGGAVSAEGASSLLAMLKMHASLSSLAIHNLDQGGASSSTISQLRHCDGLKELVWGGKTDETVELCRLPVTMHGLRSLELNHCGLDQSAWRELAQSLKSSDALCELRIVGERLPESPDLADAIEKARNLRSLTFENCDIRERQADGLARAIARNPSVLVLRVLLRRSDGDGQYVTQAFAYGLRERGNLLQFDVSREVYAGWTNMQDRLQHNRLVGAKFTSEEHSTVTTTTTATTMTTTTTTTATTITMATAHTGLAPGDER